MKDGMGRNIDYLRLSVTDRCNLRCRYCMPHGIQKVSREEILQYGEITRLVGLLAKLGIKHVRVTGGEPLVRGDVTRLVAGLKSIPGIDKVSMTTNGVLLEKYAKGLKDAGLDSVNISLDTPDPCLAKAITGFDGVPEAVERGIAAMRELGIPTKLNSVLLADTAEAIPHTAKYAEQGIPVRFIELMPMGLGKNERGISPADALEILKKRYPDLHPVDVKLGSGPAKYYESEKLSAPIGMIDAVSNRFCHSCNRVRLTSMGVLKPCLCFEEGVALRELLRGRADDAALLAAMEGAILNKPKQHCFDAPERMTESKLMSEIGG